MEVATNPAIPADIGMTIFDIVFFMLVLKSTKSKSEIN